MILTSSYLNKYKNVCLQNTELNQWFQTELNVWLKMIINMHKFLRLFLHPCAELSEETLSFFAFRVISCKTKWHHLSRIVTETAWKLHFIQGIRQSKTVHCAYSKLIWFVKVNTTAWNTSLIGERPAPDPVTRVQSTVLKTCDHEAE